MKSASESRFDRSGPGLGWKSAVESAKKQRKKFLLEIDILSRLSHVSSVTVIFSLVLIFSAEYHQYYKGVLFATCVVGHSVSSA